MRIPEADSARQTSRKGGRFVPARTDSLLSVTFMSLDQITHFESDFQHFKAFDLQSHE